MRVERFSFGSIQIDGVAYEHDVVLDRGEGGEDNIRAAGIPYSPLFRVSDLQLD